MLRRHLINFNSIKVRLKLAFSNLSLNTVEFQFHKGTIKTPIPASSVAAILDFNSIKVRLKLSTPAYVIRLKAFQFHKGTIKTGISSFVVASI